MQSAQDLALIDRTLAVRIDGPQKRLARRHLALDELGALRKQAADDVVAETLDHLISEELPPCEAGQHMSNSDPVTGQAAWFDVRVKVYKAGAGEPEETWPQFKVQKWTPGQGPRRGRWQAYFAGLFRKKAGIES